MSFSLDGMLKKFSKLKISVVSEDADFSESFEVQFNPESYTRDIQVSYQPPKTIHAHTPRVKLLKQSIFTGQKLEAVSFQLSFDGTVSGQDGLLLGFLAGETLSVEKHIKNILDTCLTVNEKLHEPSIVKLEWGSLSFIGRMLSANTKYLLFNEDGSPIRATMDVKFSGHFQTAEVSGFVMSPDLTHTLTVHAGDTLPLMTEKIYGSARYYPQIARFNQLDDFRNLVPGQKIIFPPIDTTKHS